MKDIRAPAIAGLEAVCKAYVQRGTFIKRCRTADLDRGKTCAINYALQCSFARQTCVCSELFVISVDLNIRTATSNLEDSTGSPPTVHYQISPDIQAARADLVVAIVIETVAKYQIATNASCAAALLYIGVTCAGNVAADSQVAANVQQSSGNAHLGAGDVIVTSIGEPQMPRDVKRAAA